MVNFTILAGGFTSFIATYVFDSDAGSLALVKQSPTGQNPSWIAPHRLNSSILYAVNEIGPVGNLQSFSIDEAGSLTLVDTVATGGNGPTFTEALTTGEVSAMNFGSPNASFIATDPEDPARFLRDSPVVDFPVGNGPSNPHQSLEFNGEIFVPDLGADKIWRIVNDGAPGKFKVQGQIDIAPGNGPRHVAVQDNILFVLHEKTSVLTAHQIPTAPNGTTLPVLANVSIVPAEASNINGSFFAAEIVISEPSEAFPDPIIYVSNRNLGPEFDERGDTIAIFEYAALTGGGNGTEPASTEPLPSSESTVAEPSATEIIRLAPAFTTLVAAKTTPAVKRAEPQSKRMAKYHARRRTPHELARRQGDYGYGDSSYPEPAASSSTGAAPTGTTLTLVPGSETATPTSAGPIQATATPTAATLRLTNQVFTGLSQIRSFAIGKTGGGGDEFLIAGANTEGGVAVFRRIDGGKNLELVVRNQELQNRTSFVFL
jgi:6-phosphogluconolactonase (cycloisomerase 2 family)